MKLKFLTLNIWNGGKLKDQSIPFLLKENPDIFAIQEVYQPVSRTQPHDLDTIYHLDQAFPDYHHSFIPAWQFKKDEDIYNLGNATFSRFPIIRENLEHFIKPTKIYTLNPNKDYREYPKYLLHNQIKVGDTILNIINVHGIWGFEGEDNPERLKMGKIIASYISDLDNIIMAGDFNLQPDTRSVSLFTKYVDSVFGSSLTSTFNMKQKEDPGFSTASPDMIFHSPNLEVVSKKCHQVNVSDHLPLSAQFIV